MLLAPGGRALLVDVYAPGSALRSSQWMLRRLVDRVVP
jgi:hypothetical protein